MILKFHSHRNQIFRSLRSIKQFSEVQKVDEAQSEKRLQSLNEQRQIIKREKKSEFGPGRDPYSTFPEEVKALQHQTLKEVDPQQEKERMLQLIEEAKSKVKPLEMSEEDRNKYFKTMEELKKDKEIVFVHYSGKEILDQAGMNLEHLRKLQDKHYEVDIHYEQTRDLYEKQRVKDEFLEKHQEDNQMLNGYYQNTYFKARVNKFDNVIFINTYNPKDLRFNYLLSIATTGVTTAFLALVNPFLPLILLYDYYLLIGFTKVLNQTTFLIKLDESKRNLYLDRFNFLGYFREPEHKRFSLRNIRFMGEYTNKYVNIDNRGLLPSLSRMINFGGKKKKDTPDLNEKIGNKRNQSEPKKDEEEAAPKERDQSNFKYFWKFMADNETFLIPIDHEKFSNGVLNKDLLLDAINGRQNRVLNYDFSLVESEVENLYKLHEEIQIKTLKKRGDFLITEEQKKTRSYQYFHPNREFSGKMENLKLKKVDDGTFIDNGYR